MLRCARNDVNRRNDVKLVIKQYGAVYILTNDRNNVLYTGVTADLVKRVWIHKRKLQTGFTYKYNVSKLVYYEWFENIKSAIIREKQIKAGSRQKKIDLINKFNPEWKDLSGEML